MLLVLALALAVLVKTFLAQAFYIPSGSMRPGLDVNDRILVQKVSYWGGGSPDRGDVVVFEDPGGWLGGTPPGPTGTVSRLLAKVGLYPTGGHLVKRVVGVAGDTVECCDVAGRLVINGVAVDEDDFIVPQQDCDGPMPSDCRGRWEVTVPEDRLFVMGDNRAASADSSARLCGPPDEGCDDSDAFVPEELVVGKVFAVVWPLRRLELVGSVDAFDDVPDPS